MFMLDTGSFFIFSHAPTMNSGTFPRPGFNLTKTPLIQVSRIAQQRVHINQNVFLQKNCPDLNKPMFILSLLPMIN
jgi:hypothetical protein